MATTVKLDMVKLAAVAGEVEACADGTTRVLVNGAAEIASGGMPGAQLAGAITAAGDQLVTRADRVESELRDWADAVRVGGEVFEAADRHLGTRARQATTGRQVAR